MMKICETRKLCFIHSEFGDQGSSTSKQFTPVRTYPRINSCFVFLTASLVLSFFLQLHDIFLLHGVGEIRCGKDLIHPHDKAKLSPECID